MITELLACGAGLLAGALAGGKMVNDERANHLAGMEERTRREMRRAEEVEGYREATAAISAERWRAWEAYGGAIEVLRRHRRVHPDPITLDPLAAWLDGLPPDDRRPIIQSELRAWAAEARTLDERIAEAAESPASMHPDQWESRQAAKRAG